MQLEVGKEYIYKGQQVKCTARWAQGKFCTYHFDNGSSFNGDPAGLFANGDLREIVDLPPAKRVDPVTDPNWKRAKAVPTIVPTPKWLLGDEKDGKTPKS